MVEVFLFFIFSKGVQGFVKLSCLESLEQMEGFKDSRKAECFKGGERG